MGPIQQRARTGGKAPPRAVHGTPAAFWPWEQGGELPLSDELFRLVPLVTAIRWAATAVSLILLSTGDPSSTDGLIGAAVLSYALWRTVRPVDFSGGAAELAAILVEGAVTVTALVASGYWNSPYAFGLVTVIAAAGFSGGIPLAVEAGAVCVVAVAVPYHLVGDASGRLTVQWAGELLLVAILAGYARRLSLQARAETSRYEGRLRQLAEVNDLLLQLRNLAQTLPMSLDLTDTLDSSVARLQELFQPETAVVLLREGDQWTLARSSGARLSRRMTTADLPPVLRRTLDAPMSVLAVSGGDASIVLLELESQSGLYGRLSAREDVVGLIAVERRTAASFTQQDQVMMEEFCQQMAIGVDNARWFSRIGLLAAEQERSRIARDLHDRVGQSLALVGYELDRAAKKTADPDVSEQLIELREHVRSVVGELRSTLHDLRTDVSEDQDLVAAMGGFLDRVSARSGLRVEFRHQARQRLALNVEREVWRIAQEAVFNAERHAKAASITVTWKSDEAGAELRVVDDGRGMPRSAPERAEGYGLRGMQERARAIDATLVFSSLPARGTTVRLNLRK